MKRLNTGFLVLALIAILLSSCNLSIPASRAADRGTPTGQAGSPAAPAKSGTPIVPWLSGSYATPTGTATANATATITPIATQTALPAISAIVPVSGSGPKEIGSLGGMLGYRVLDSSGADIGQISDFVVNLCEHHILYALIQPAPGGRLPGNRSLLVPYEAFTAAGNNGRVDTRQRTLTLNASVKSLGDAPAAEPASLNLQYPTWDVKTLAYWQPAFNLTLSAGCQIGSDGAVLPTNKPSSGQKKAPTAQRANRTPVPPTAVPPTAAPPTAVPPTGVPPTAPPPTARPTFVFPTFVFPTPRRTPRPTQPKPTKKPKKTRSDFVVVNYIPDRPGNPAAMPAYSVIYRNGLASQMAGAPLRDTYGNLIAAERDIAVFPQTGDLFYYVFEDAANPGRLVALPSATITIRYDAGPSGPRPSLVMNVSTNEFKNAPEFNPSQGNTGQEWFVYWLKYILTP